MIYTGCHLSSAKGFEAMGKNALKLGADTFAFFTRNPRGGNAKAIDPADAARFRELTAKHHFGKIVAHAPYTLNPWRGERGGPRFCIPGLPGGSCPDGVHPGKLL